MKMCPELIWRKREESRTRKRRSRNCGKRKRVRLGKTVENRVEEVKTGNGIRGRKTIGDEYKTNAM